MTVTNDEVAVAISVTGTFENSGDPYLGVTGNFDGMGISCGVLQWNIGSNSLQPLVRLAAARRRADHAGERRRDVDRVQFLANVGSSDCAGLAATQ